MKIRRINFICHPFFRNIEFDFTDANGRAIDTIIIAGENGTGKSLLLNKIFDLSNLNYNKISEDEHIIYEIELTRRELDNIKTNSSTLDQIFNKVAFQTLFVIEINGKLTGREKIKIYYGLTNNAVQTIDNILIVDVLRSAFRMIFSDVEINFTPQIINTVTSSNLDNGDNRNERSNSNLATEITQLLVDVQTLDSIDFTDWARRNSGQIIDDDLIDTRTKRFTKAFDYMFPDKRFKRIGNINNQKLVVFEENGREMGINDLSSGEKQVVFRGGFLLKDKESSKGALILIDEPEISLHPVWQLKVLSFFKMLFTNEEGAQTSQLIISTHSPFIIHNLNRSDDKVIILKKENGITKIANENSFFSWTPEKQVEEAFNISQILSTNKITVLLEGETDEIYFNECIDAYGLKNLPIEFKWVGRAAGNSKIEFTGKNALNHVKAFSLANPKLLNRKIILLFDNDTKKPEESHENLLVREMKVNQANSLYKAGVENLLTLIPKLNPSEFYKEEKRTNAYGAESIIRDLNKMKLCHATRLHFTKEEKQIIYSKIKEEVDRLISEIKDQGW